MNKNITGEIQNIQDLCNLLDTIFENNKHYKNVEWAEIEKGYRVKISMEFWRGPFNEAPIKFVYYSSYSKIIYANNFIMSMLGKLSEGSYIFYFNDKGYLKVKKQIECY